MSMAVGKRRSSNKATSQVKGIPERVLFLPMPLLMKIVVTRIPQERWRTISDLLTNSTHRSWCYSFVGDLSRGARCRGSCTAIRNDESYYQNNTNYDNRSRHHPRHQEARTTIAFSSHIKYKRHRAQSKTPFRSSVDCVVYSYGFEVYCIFRNLESSLVKKRNARPSPLLTSWIENFQVSFRMKSSCYLRWFLLSLSLLCDQPPDRFARNKILRPFRVCIDWSIFQYGATVD